MPSSVHVKCESPTVVAVFAPTYPPAFRGGGPARSLEALAKLSPESLRPLVLAPDRDMGTDTPLTVGRNSWVLHDGVSVYYASLSSFRQFWRALYRLRARRPDLLHLNSFFNPLLSIVPVVLWRFGFWGGAPVLLLAPRGEFGAGALRRHPARKYLYRTLFRALRLHRAVIWHSTAEHESDDIRRVWGEHVRIVLRENDTLLPSKPVKLGSELTPTPKAIFLGRIVEHKGLAIALESLRHCPMPIKLDVYGAEEDAVYVDRCKASAAALPDWISVTFHSAIEPSEVRATLAKYDVLVLPTAGENFGHVIAEALSASCIVMTTPLTPWSDILSEGAGIVVPNRSPEAWSRAFQALANMSTDERLVWRRKAGEAYSVWVSQPRSPHVWSLALDKLAGTKRRRASITTSNSN